MSFRGTPLWPLFACATLLPVLATLVAYALSIQAGLVPACLPIVEGCTSISRAARHGLGNHVFRALVLPAATLQALMWCLVALQLGDALGRRKMHALWLLGVLAGSFLVLYATFLGTDGAIYRHLRQFGVIVYFGGTYLAQLLVTASYLHHQQTRRIGRAMTVLCLAMLLLGIVSTIASAMDLGPALKDRVENALEWQLAVLVTIWLSLLTWSARTWRIQLRAAVGNDRE